MSDPGSFSNNYPQPLTMESIKKAVSTLKAMNGSIGQYFGVDFATYQMCACGHYKANHAQSGNCFACMPTCVSFAEDNLDWLLQREKVLSHQKNR